MGMNNMRHSDTPTSSKDKAEKISLRILPYGQDILEELANHIIQYHADALPDLTRITILLPSSKNNIQLRKYLLIAANNAGHNALLGPEISTLPHWINQSSPANYNVLTDQQRELMLVEALDNHSYLYGKASPWSFAESLLNLFDELSDRNIQLPVDFNDFLQQVHHAYQGDNKSETITSEGLTGEARLVHTLWKAWHKQFQEYGVVDRHTSYLLKLKSSTKDKHPNRIFYLAGFSQFSNSELTWLKYFMQQNNAYLWVQSSQPLEEETEYHPDNYIRRLLSALQYDFTYPSWVDDYGHCLDSIFNAPSIALQDRAKQFAINYPSSPLTSRLSFYEARSAEQEAMAIDLQTRLWLIEGKKKIGIVTENRRLARRVRALLERANIEIQDEAGWALSTTSASATLERWLESIEEDFAYQPFLDLLKSPFFFPSSGWPEEGRGGLLATVFRFEQSIVLKENISRGLSRYKQHIRYRQNRLDEKLAAEYENIHRLLDIVSDAAEPLTPYLGNDKHNPANILGALQESLSLIGLNDSFSNDDAGRKLIQELENLHAASLTCTLPMNWREFRNWLGRTLEQFNFQPNTQTGHVQLMSMTQNPLYQFDGLIIAGAEKDYLPGKPGNSPFFNEGVRLALGLGSSLEQITHRFYLFRRLLESSKNILVTRRIEHENEDVVCSPWVERIQSFHAIGYQNDLVNHSLSQLVGNSETLVSDLSAPLPKPVKANPVTSVSADLIPGYISASSYQQLMDCPYQFFAARCLKLEPPESIKELLEKSDYGERVHLCLQAFHSGSKNLPGPFSGKLDEDNREEAIQVLSSIADVVFAKDLEDNFLHRAWLKQWKDLIPSYIDWQIKHEQTWKVESTELKMEVKLEGMEIPLRGRIDRIDMKTDRTGAMIDILDYKTGQVAGEKEVLAGESIQLPFYALLAYHPKQKQVSQVEYVSIGKGEVRTRTTIESDMLSNLSHQIGQRLVKITNEIAGGELLTAWGDKTPCDRCQMSGICRQESWLIDNHGEGEI